MQPPRAARFEVLTDLAIYADVGPAEAINRLLRIADDEETTGNRDSRAPVGVGGIGGGKQQQNLGLERIRVLEFVDEQMRETRLEPSPYRLVAFDQSAGLEQQVEEVERAGAGFQVFVAIDRPLQLLLQARREVRVGVEPEAIQMSAERLERLDDDRSRDTRRVSRTTPVTRPGEIAVAR